MLDEMVCYTTSTKISSDTQITPVGTPTRVFTMVVGRSLGAGEGKLLNGDSSGTLFIHEKTPANPNKETYEYGETGILFPNGLYVDVATSLTQILVEYLIEQ